MANEEHLAILQQGVAIWHKWRMEHPSVKPNLSHAILSDATLRYAYLRNANLSNANLSNADLRNANLISANLSSAKFNSANLTSATLRNTPLISANLSGANLSYANLNYTILRYANLRDANLSNANLSYANLMEADLSNANLSNADLISAILISATLRNADLSNALLRWTVFGNIDMSEVKGLEGIIHRGPSIIGIDSFYQSQGHIPYKFLLDAGVPKDDIAYLLSLAGKAFDFHSCFISYSSQDQAFAERLHADLQAKGVRCWYAPEDLTIGEPFLLGIDKGIRLHDKLLLVLSEHSIGSGWVQHEVLSALAKEQGKEPWVLFPVRLDDTVLQTSVPWANMIKQSRHIGDFTQWKDHDAYQKAFDRLLRDLKAETQK